MRRLTGAMQRLRVSSARRFAKEAKVSSAEPHWSVFVLAGCAGVVAGDLLYTTCFNDDSRVLMPVVDYVVESIEGIKDKAATITEEFYAQRVASIAAKGEVSAIQRLIKNFKSKLTSEVLLAGLCSAIVCEQKEIANILLKEYGDGAPQKFLALGLRYAVGTEQEELAKFLLEKGADPQNFLASSVRINTLNDRELCSMGAYTLRISPYLPYGVGVLEKGVAPFEVALGRRNFKLARLLLEYETKNKDYYRSNSR